MIRLIKKLAEARKAKRLVNSRLEDNHKQLNLIYQGLIERGF